MESARKQAEYQASNSQVTHGGPNALLERFIQAGFQAQAVAENVAGTGNASTERVMMLWINSPGTSMPLQANY
jgi:uncharacterized protein YkwD